MDINRYLDMKQKGTVKMQVFSGVLVMTQKCFCQDTGVSLEPQVSNVSVKQMQQQTAQTIAALESQIASLKAFEQDVQAAVDAAGTAEEAQ